MATTFTNGGSFQRAVPKRIRKSLKTVREDLRTLRGDLSALAHAAGDESGTRVRHMSDVASHRARDAFDALQTRIHERPNVALLIAAGAGVLIGALFAARR